MQGKRTMIYVVEVKNQPLIVVALIESQLRRYLD